MTTAIGAQAPLSTLHAMLASIKRETDGHSINRIANDPSVLPFVQGYENKLDLSAAASDLSNVLLVGEHGCVFFHSVTQGLFEAHTMVLPGGRGAWTVSFVNAALHWLFTHTIAVEVYTRVPKGNDAALGLVRAIHGKFEFTRQKGWVMDFDPVPCGIYSLNVTDWMRAAPGLIERGHWFHEKLEQEYTRLGHAEKPHGDDQAHDRFVGAAVEMILAGQPDKGVLLYNRWALMAGYKPVEITARSPLTINIRDAIIIVREKNFWIAACRLEQQ